jgi:hypothetical protein
VVVLWILSGIFGRGIVFIITIVTNAGMCTVASKRLRWTIKSVSSGIMGYVLRASIIHLNAIGRDGGLAHTIRSTYALYVERLSVM